MTLLRLTWGPVFTSVGVDTNCDAAFALQWMFVFFNSLQGFFVFIFFVVLSAEARNSWLNLLFPCYSSTGPPTSKSHIRYTGETSSTMKQNTFSSNEYSSMTLEESAHKEELSHEMIVIGHSVINEQEAKDNFLDLNTVETALGDKRGTEIQEVSEKSKQRLLEDTSKDAEGKVLRARVKRVSTKRKTHHVETCEVDFFDKFSDESEGDDIAVIPWAYRTWIDIPL